MWFSPYYLGLSFMSVGVGALDDPNIVGDDILGVPFIKISLRFARDAEDVVPYRFGGFLNSMPVGEDIILPIYNKKTGNLKFSAFFFN